MSAQAFPYKVHTMEITQKASKGEQPYTHATHRLNLIYQSDTGLGDYRFSPLRLPVRQSRLRVQAIYTQKNN